MKKKTTPRDDQTARREESAQKPIHWGGGYYPPKGKQEPPKLRSRFSTSGYTPQNGDGHSEMAGAHVAERAFREAHAKTRWLIRGLTVFLSLVLLYSLYNLGTYVYRSIKEKSDEAWIQQMIAENEQTPRPVAGAVFSGQPTLASTCTPTSVEEEAEIVDVCLATDADARLTVSPKTAPTPQIMFHEALKINADTVGQLKCGEDIKAYVVQRDNSYYLDHSFKGEQNPSGNIFMDITCSILPRSRNLIIHGHNMRDGTAFGKLKRFEDIEYLIKYPVITFSTLYDFGYYNPFAVVRYSVNPKSKEYLDIYAINNITDDEFIDFASSLQARSIYQLSVRVTKTDQIITLVTCYGGFKDDRFAVFAARRK